MVRYRRRRPWGRLYKWFRGGWHYKRRPKGRWYRSSWGRKRRYHHRYRRGLFGRNFKRSFYVQHPGSYTVRRTNPYNTQRLRFQGLILVNNAVTQTGTSSVSNMRATAIEISLRGLLLAYFMNHSTGGPGWAGDSGTKVAISPLEWWRWAYIRIEPCNDGRVFGMAVPHDEVLYNWFCQWQLFKHVKTDLRVLNTDVRTSAEARIVASLLVQDSYWQVGNRGATQLSQIKFPSFLELSAWGAQWSFQPGLQSVSSRSFNHHSFVGTNDPMGEPWKVFCPLDNMTQQDTQISWVYATLFLAEFASVTNKQGYNTEQTSLEMQALSDTWAVIKVRSEWMLGNQNRVKSNMVTFTTGEPP
ncbi:VP1 [Gyrovirus Tu243]|uniref:Capsid protein n=1 Tax=Gyrovirus Tu243 TaxID=1415627 RepID=U5UAI8_9VIRU|nr:VP1 [Gyrovirus Tu243]AGZ20415.1 VP1 [Gyrovirus Tu243]